MDLKRKQRIWHLGIFIVFAALTVWLSADRIHALRTGSVHPATVLDCDGEWFRKGQGGTRPTRYVLQYAPVAYSEDGHRARGFAWLDESVCLRTLGSAVTLLAHPDDPKQNRIVTFLHFWLLPAGATLLTLILGLGLLSLPRGMPMIVFLLGASAGGGTLWFELNPSVGAGGLDPSERALAQCAQQAVFDQKVSDRTQIRRLICQNPAVEDLAPLAAMPQLEELYLQGASLTSLDGIEALPKLRKLSVAGNKDLDSLTGLETATALIELQANSAGLKSLRGLEGALELKVVAAMNNRLTGAALEPLKGLQKLESVVMNSNRISDLSALRDKPALRELQVYSNDIRDIRPLHSNRALNLVGIRGRGNVSCAEVDALRAVLAPDARVYGQAACDDK
ncbi:MAG: leucine-rich repeat domain-containing protein [Pseudomonadota bacterium]